MIVTSCLGKHQGRSHGIQHAAKRMSTFIISQEPLVLGKRASAQICLKRLAALDQPVWVIMMAVLHRRRKQDCAGGVSLVVKILVQPNSSNATRIEKNCFSQTSACVEEVGLTEESFCQSRFQQVKIAKEMSTFSRNAHDDNRQTLVFCAKLQHPGLRTHLISSFLMTSSQARARHWLCCCLMPMQPSQHPHSSNSCHAHEPHIRSHLC